jgi:hypothetical protein
MLHLNLARNTAARGKGRDTMMRSLKRRQLRTVQRQRFGTAMDNIISDLATRFHTTAKIVEELSSVLKVGKISEDKVPSVCQPLITKYSRGLNT